MKLKVLFACLFLASCGGGGSESDSPSDRVDPPVNPPSFSEVCIDAGLNIERCTFTHNNIERYYLIYVPANIDQSSEIPLLFSLHGYGGSAIRNIEYKIDCLRKHYQRFFVQSINTRQPRKRFQYHQQQQTQEIYQI